MTFDLRTPLQSRKTRTATLALVTAMGLGQSGCGDEAETETMGASGGAVSGGATGLGGTGVGGGIITDGRLLRGHFDNGAELGHTIVQPGGRPCGCGQNGCLEAYASASYTARRATEAVEAGERSSLADVLKTNGEITSEDVVNAASVGDALAARIFDETCMYLAVACVNMQHAINPERILMAGGMIHAGEDVLLKPIRQKAAEMTWKAAEDLPEIMFATLGNDAGLIGAAGAAWLAREEGEI